MTGRISVVATGVLLGVLAVGASSSASPRTAADPTSGSQEALAIDVGSVVAIPSRFGLPVVEPHVAAHPNDAKVLLVGAMVVTDVSQPYRSSRLSSFVSRDAGQTWTETAHDWWGYDPWVALLPGDEAVLAWIGNPRRFRDTFPVQFFSSADSGATWSPRVRRAAGNHDGTKLASRDGLVVFSTVRFRPHDPADGHSMAADVVLFRRQEDGTFAEVAVVDGGGGRPGFCQPAILGDGRVLVPALRFGQEAWVEIFDPFTGRLSDPRRITTRPGGRRGYPHLAVDAGSASPFRDRAYYVRALSDSEGAGVRVDVSSDGGMTWQEGGRVDRFEGDRPGLPMVATPAVNRHGILGIAWVDRRRPEDRRANDLYFAASLDGGHTFGDPVRITEIGSDPSTTANGVAAERFPGGGHYLGLDARADSVFQAVWSDSLEGPFVLRTAPITVLGLPSAAPTTHPACP